MNFKQSLDFGLDQSLHINPINVAPKSRFHRNLYGSEFQNPSILINKCINVLSENRLNSSLAVNDQFQQYLTQDIANPDAVIISFIGNKEIGKSFLIDSLLTAQNNKICRIMCKNKSKIINSPAIPTKTSANHSRLIYFDCSGDPTDSIFLWNYFLSSIVVYNIQNYDADKQNRFFNNLDFVKNHLNTESGDFSLPQLIVVIRDTDQQKVNSKQYKQFILEVEKYEIFQPKITYICMPYPGKSDVATKQIVDVPLMELNPLYLAQVDRLMKLLKNGKPKIIKGNYISTKILSLALQPVAKSINKQHTINTNKVWDEIIENLSIGFYNYYLRSYENELLSQFENEEPQDKYSLYKKLTNMKRKINKKIEGFKTLEHEPIFSKYKNRLNTVVKQKQNLIKEINQAKSKEANDSHCRRLLTQINANNAHQILQQYNKTGLTDQKAEVLVQNFVKIIEQRASKVKRNPGKSSNLQSQVKELEQQVINIRGKVKNTNKVSSPEQAKKTIEQKNEKIKQLKKQESQLKGQIDRLLHNQKKSPQLIGLEQQKQKLSEKIEKDQNQAIELRQQRERQMRELTKRQESEVKKQQDNLKVLQQRLKQLKSRKPVEKAKQKQGCCNLI